MPRPDKATIAWRGAEGPDALQIKIRAFMVVLDLEMPWVLSGCRNSSNLTYETISFNTHYGNSRTGKTESQKRKIAKQFLLGIDAHENSYQVGRKIDAGRIQPVQSFKPDKFLGFVAKQLQLAEKVYAVYEAGPFGLCALSQAQGTRG